MANPTIEELQNEEQFELIAELDHKEIKEFVINQLTTGGLLVKLYMIYQLVMLLFGSALVIWSVIQASKQNTEPLYSVLAALLFCFSFLIVLHELIHGLALKLTGAKKINYGAYLKKFIFYAEADRHVFNKKQFSLIALAPLLVVKIFSFLVIGLFYPHPMVFFFAVVMCAHSLFCAGDIGLLSLFYQDKNAAIFTYDVKDEKKSYYFKRKDFWKKG